MPPSVHSGRFFLILNETVQKDLDIQKYTDPEHNPMIPHTLVLKPGLIIHRIYNGYWFWGRTSVIDLWHDLSAVTSEIRPDWDLSAPGLRDAWNRGDRSPFHGWNKGTKAICLDRKKGFDRNDLLDLDSLERQHGATKPILPCRSPA